MIVIIKPTYACNFACKYCYLSNETKSPSYCVDLKFIKDALLQVRDELNPTQKKVTTILWHGGEPLLWGYENYKNVFEYIEDIFQGYNYQLSIQTNLSLINTKFIELFKKHKVNVGFSLDGTKDIHNLQRVDQGGRGTFELILNKYSLCKENGINPGCIVVATKKHIGKIAELYEFMSSNGIDFKMNPIFCAGEAENNDDDYGLTPLEYAQMSIELFDLWYNDKKSGINNPKFSEIASALITRQTTLCDFSKNCQDNVFAISPYGEIFPCGRFCDSSLKQYSYGNLHNEPLSLILSRRKETNIYKREQYIKNSDCKDCKYYDICYGGCLHDGYLVNKDFKTKSFLCEAYKIVFPYIEAVIDKDKNLFEAALEE